MTAEEYVVERLNNTEKELAKLKAEYEDMTEKVKRLISENGRVTDTLGFVAEVLNPRIKVYGGSRSIECDEVADWLKGGESKVDRMIEIFGLCNDDDVG